MHEYGCFHWSVFSSVRVEFCPKTRKYVSAETIIVTYFTQCCVETLMHCEIKYVASKYVFLKVFKLADP